MLMLWLWKPYIFLRAIKRVYKVFGAELIYIHLSAPNTIVKNPLDKIISYKD